MTRWINLPSLRASIEASAIEPAEAAGMENVQVDVVILDLDAAPAALPVIEMTSEQMARARGWRWKGN